MKENFDLHFVLQTCFIERKWDHLFKMLSVVVLFFLLVVGCFGYSGQNCSSHWSFCVKGNGGMMDSGVASYPAKFGKWEDIDATQGTGCWSVAEPQPSGSWYTLTQLAYTFDSEKTVYSQTFTYFPSGSDGRNGKLSVQDTISAFFDCAILSQGSYQCQWSGNTATLTFCDC